MSPFRASSVALPLVSLLSLAALGCTAQAGDDAGQSSDALTRPIVRIVPAPAPTMTYHPPVYSARYDAQLRAALACGSLDGANGTWVASFTFDATTPQLCSYTWYAPSDVPADLATLNAVVLPYTEWLRPDTTCTGMACAPLVLPELEVAGGGVEGSIACSACTVVGVATATKVNVVIPPTVVKPHIQTLVVLTGIEAEVVSIDVPANAQVVTAPVSLATLGTHTVTLKLDDAPHDPFVRPLAP